MRDNDTGLLEKLQHREISVGGVRLGFQRTCRVPEGKTNALPAGLGTFPAFKVSDFKSGVPEDWHGEAYFIPMYQSEAMWINFDRSNRTPKAMIIAAGNINAISGKPFDPAKTKGSRKSKKGKFDIRLEEEQNYIVIPPQPWIDGWKAEDGIVYQFVAAPLGSGETVEGQITGEETVGGIQFLTYDSKPGQKLIPESRPHEYVESGGYIEECFGLGGKGVLRSRSMLMSAERKGVQGMGLGRGGAISQKIYPDIYGLKVWNTHPTEISRVYIVSSPDFKQITGRDAPPTPITYAKYQELNLPWFDLYDEKLADTKGSKKFKDLKPVSGGPKMSEPDNKSNYEILK